MTCSTLGGLPHVDDRADLGPCAFPARTAPKRRLHTGARKTSTAGWRAHRATRLSRSRRPEVSPRSRAGRWDRADLPKQAQSVPVHPFFDELAVGNPAEELPVHIDRFAGGRGAFQLAPVCPAQRPVGFDHVALGDLTFDSQIEVM